MLIEGRLERWNDERGFGFIVPLNGGDDIFVHVSAFPHDGRRPQNGEILAFSIELDAGGRKRASTVRRPSPAERPPARIPRPTARDARQDRPNRVGALLLALLVAAGVYAYQRFRQPAPVAVEAAPVRNESGGGPAGRLAAEPLASKFSCDGRIYCQQMTSCEEARYFLQHCPGVRMDGDHDGIPCEDALCGR